MKNLQFAQTVEPENAKISQKLAWAQQQRQSGLPTIPSTIGEELEINPFMRSDLPEVQVLLSFLNPSTQTQKRNKIVDGSGIISNNNAKSAIHKVFIIDNMIPLILILLAMLSFLHAIN